MLPSKQELRESIIRRLTAVSDDICSAFQRTVDGYKTELDRQRRLIDVVWNPNIRLHVSDLQLLCDDVLVSTRRREPQPGPSQDGEPQPGPSQDGELQPGPSQDGELQPGPSQDGELQPGPSQDGELQPGPSQDGELQPGPSQDGELQPGPSQDGELQPGPSQDGELQPGPSQDGEPKPGPSHENPEDSSVEDAAEPERHTEPGTGKSFVECHECGKTFKLTFQLKRHLRIHTDKPYRCQT